MQVGGATPMNDSLLPTANEIFSYDLESDEGDA